MIGVLLFVSWVCCHVRTLSSPNPTENRDKRRKEGIDGVKSEIERSYDGESRVIYLCSFLRSVLF